MRELVLKTVQQAGEILMRYFKSDRRLALMRGAVKEVSTRYDKMVDEFIFKALSKEYPSYNFLTEERGLVDRASTRTWVIDSLDGTVNFAYGNPLFTICVALLEKGKPIASAIHAPALGELYWAERGKGAFLDKHRIGVTEIDDLGKSYVYVCEGGERNRERVKQIISRMYARVVDLRKLGSAGLEAAWVAAGRAEGYVTTQLEAWDVAAGVLLVEEAGGRVTDFRGKPWRPERSDLVFSNGRIHTQLLKLVEGL